MNFMSLAGIGVPGLVLILIVVLLIFGPKKLPELARSVGKSAREFQKGIKGVQDDLADIKKDVEDVKKDVTAESVDAAEKKEEK